MIIKTMEQVGKCMDDGVELEFQVQKDGIWKTTKIAAIYHGFNASLMSCWISYIEQGRIRTKPHTVDVVIETFDGTVINAYLNREVTIPINPAQVIRTTHTIPLDEK